MSLCAVIIFSKRIMRYNTTRQYVNTKLCIVNFVYSQKASKPIKLGRVDGIGDSSRLSAPATPLQCTIDYNSPNNVRGSIWCS